MAQASSSAQWHTSENVVVVKNIGALKGEHFKAVDAEIITLMRAAPKEKTVHVVVDCLEMTEVPPLSDLEFGRILRYFNEPNCGWTVIVDNKNNVLLHVISRLLTAFGGKHLQIESSLDKALSFIGRMDSLPVRNRL
jgi:hypothetical protein